MLSIYKMTLNQILRLPLLWWSMMSVIVLSEIMPSFAEVTAFGNVKQAVLDCAQATAWGSILITIVMSSYMTLGKELDERVALTVFTKPISFRTFLLAKIMALTTGITLVFLIQALMISRLGWIYEWESSSYWTFATTLWLILVQGMMLLSINTLASTVFKSASSLWITVAIWALPLVLPPSFYPWVCWACPMWVWFDVSFEIYHNIKLSTSTIFFLSLYGLLYSGCWLELSSWALKKRQF
jgi:ABC-type transport system involved in multi-copper enzyme maturation permease subunit